jgi:ABC-type transport system involved in cytochrome c biogenesis permease subunit
MSGLTIPETIVLISATAGYIIAAVLAVLQLRPAGDRYKHYIGPVVSLAIILEACFLIFRAAELKAIPLTGLFESMIVLTIVFGLIFLFLSAVIRQVWFSVGMIFVILVLILMTWIVARPATQAAEVAATPWAIAHGIAMILGAVSITYATVNAFLYLLSIHKLKKKQIMQVLGKVPNIEKLENMNLMAIRAAFIFITFGIISGLGMAFTRLAVMGKSVSEWLTDSKVLCIIAAWIMLAIILTLNRMLLLKGKARATITIIVFVLVLFAVLGATILGATLHNFSAVIP